MKITWDWSLESESNRLLQASLNIANGFYALNHFYPLPWEPSVTYHPTGVYLPVLPYPTIPHFWTRAKNLDDLHLPLLAPPDLTSNLVKLLTPLDLSRPNTTAMELQIRQVLSQVITWLKQFTHSLYLPDTLTIYPTYFGTGGSFTRLKQSGGDMAIFLRIDQGFTTLVECFLTGCLRAPAMKQLSADWGQTEFLVDYLLHSSSLAKLLPKDANWQGTIAATNHSDPHIVAASQAFLTQVNAPTSTSQHFRLDGASICYGETALSTLSSREHIILSQLIARSPAPVTTDELADLLYPDPAKFSLAALTKCVERLRDKLEALGISRHHLATANGVGYYLKN